MIYFRTIRIINVTVKEDIWEITPLAGKFRQYTTLVQYIGTNLLKNAFCGYLHR